MLGVAGDQVMHIAEMLHNDLRQPLCIKVLQRRAEARKVSGGTFPELDLCQCFHALGLYHKNFPTLKTSWRT